MPPTSAFAAATPSLRPTRLSRGHVRRRLTQDPLRATQLPPLLRSAPASRAKRTFRGSPRVRQAEASSTPHLPLQPQRSQLVTRRLAGLERFASLCRGIPPAQVAAGLGGKWRVATRLGPPNGDTNPPLEDAVAAGFDLSRDSPTKQTVRQGGRVQRAQQNSGERRRLLGRVSSGRRRHSLPDCRARRRISQRRFADRSARGSLHRERSEDDRPLNGAGRGMGVDISLVFQRS